MKVLVEIDLGDRTPADLEANRDVWFPIAGEPNLISIDNAFLTVDPTEDSFYVFPFKGVVIEDAPTGPPKATLSVPEFLDMVGPSLGWDDKDES